MASRRIRSNGSRLSERLLPGRRPVRPGRLWHIILPGELLCGAGDDLFEQPVWVPVAGMPTEKQKMLAGELYDPLDPDLVCLLPEIPAE